jgi:plastocyanin
MLYNITKKGPRSLSGRRMSMRNRSGALTALWVAALFAFAACASQQPLVTIPPAKGEAVVAVKASDFKFEPNNIKAYKGDVLVFQIENISGSGHNFTIKDPKGRVVQSISLPSKETVLVKVSLSEPGTYEFYCDKPFHSTFGMKGQIVVIQEP